MHAAHLECGFGYLCVQIKCGGDLNLLRVRRGDTDELLAIGSWSLFDWEGLHVFREGGGRVDVSLSLEMAVRLIQRAVVSDLMSKRGQLMSL